MERVIGSICVGHRSPSSAANGVYYASGMSRGWSGADMTMDSEFYQQRIAEEHAAAASATNSIVRDRHNELADLYAERLRAMSRRQSRPMKLVIDNALV